VFQAVLRFNCILANRFQMIFLSFNFLSLFYLLLLIELHSSIKRPVWYNSERNNLSKFCREFPFKTCSSNFLTLLFLPFEELQEYVKELKETKKELFSTFLFILLHFLSCISCNCCLSFFAAFLKIFFCLAGFATF